MCIYVFPKTANQSDVTGQNYLVLPLKKNILYIKHFKLQQNN